MRAGGRLGTTVVGLVLLGGLVGCERAAVQEAPDKSPVVTELVVITPHRSAIREAFDSGFRKWQTQRQLPEIITIRWLYMGTVECQRYILARCVAHGETLPRPVDVDVFFGGGVAIHQDLAERGCSQPIELPEEILRAIPERLNGQPLYAPDGSWHGSALGGYGILYNRRDCQARGIPLPTTWADLAQPAYAGWLAVADPALSGSTTQCLVLILLKHGWVDGWGMLMGILANCNGLLPSSSLIGPSIEAGMALAGFEPEFVARTSMADAPDTLDYVNPASATAITPDPVTVLRGAVHQAAAKLFVEFVLSPQGQALWALPPEVPGGPATEALYRHPIRPDIYTAHKDHLVVKGNPFEEPSDFRVDPKKEIAYTNLLPLLVKAACGANHVRLQQAWRRAAGPGADPAKLAALQEPPFDAEQAMQYADLIAHNAQEAQKLRAEWTAYFENRYRAVLGE